MEAARRLRTAGHDVVLLRDVLPIRSPDPVVLAKAGELKCVLVSLNGDFSDIVTYPPALYDGIVSLQLHNHPEILPKLLDRLLHFLASHPDPSDYAGKLFLVEAHRIRIRS
jgi:hypothetical protein